jgi:rod shape determining protein RodA
VITRYGAYVGSRPGVMRRVVARDSPLRRFDWLLNIAVLALSVLGSLLVWAATRPFLLDQHLDPASFLKKNLLNLAIGLVLGGVVAMLDYRLLRAYAPILYVASCVGLLIVLSPVGDTVNGSHSRIVLGGGFQVQPSEFAKVGLVVLLAMILGEPREGELSSDSGPQPRDVLLALGLVALPMGLTMLQPDLGTTMVFCAAILGVLIVAGVRKLYLVLLVGGGAAAAGLAVLLGLLKPYQLARFTSFLNPAADPRGTGYNSQQARIAVGSGGIFGKGLFHGEQTGGHFVPEQQTDFIFTVAGEELGFLGAALIIILIGIVLWRGLRIATQAADQFGTLVATGVVCWLAFQAFENIGMCLGIMPITGVPLPFVSYGGTATFANMIGIGLLQAVHLRHRPFD